jgi:site-specific recombinase XerD
MLRNFAAQLDKRKFSKATQRLYLAALRRLLEWLDSEDELPTGFNRSKAIAKYKVARGSARSGYKYRAPDPELARIITYYDEITLPETNVRDAERLKLELLRTRAIMHTLYASAGRVSEVATLTRAQVADGRIAEVLITGKGDKQRMLFLTPESQRAIRAYCDAREDTYAPLFISHRRGKGQALSRNAIWKVVKEAVSALGLSKTTSPHSFRHFRAVQLLNEGMPLENVQAYLGHTSPETTRIVYAHTHTSVLRDQLNTFGRSVKDVTSKSDKD